MPLLNHQFTIYIYTQPVQNSIDTADGMAQLIIKIWFEFPVSQNNPLTLH